MPSDMPSPGEAGKGVGGGGRGGFGEGERGLAEQVAEIAKGAIDEPSVVQLLQRAGGFPPGLFTP